MTIAKPQTPNLIETISAGYAVLNRRLWVLLIPVGLNLYLWLGARLSLKPFLQNLNESVEASTALLAPDTRQQEHIVHSIQNTDMRVPLAFLNFVPVLPPDVLLPQNLSATTAITVSGLPGVIGSIVIINLLALLISSVFLTILASSVLNQPYTLADQVHWVRKVIRDICGCLLLIFGVGLLLGLPFLVLSTILVGLLPGATIFVLIFWAVIGFWVYVYTGFAIEAVVLSEVGPLRAIYNSVNVVRRNLLSTLGLIFISLVVALGLEVVWRALAINPWGLVAAMAGSAYIGSGLVAARLVFYHERVLRWRLLE